jgi:hypothetical protein
MQLLWGDGMRHGTALTVKPEPLNVWKQSLALLWFGFVLCRVHIFLDSGSMW